MKPLQHGRDNPAHVGEQLLRRAGHDLSLGCAIVGLPHWIHADVQAVFYMKLYDNILLCALKVSIDLSLEGLPLEAWKE